MSEVWLAHDRALDRSVALKLHDSAASGARFRREARLAASLEHPNIVGIFDYGEFEGRPYLVLEYLAGGTLDELLAAREEPVDGELAESIAREIAAGLAHAHGRGVVHRDLKPANVLFDEEGHAKIGDFGVARPAGDADTLTSAGSILGTALYMAPEQATGTRAGPEADVYAFGLILYLLLAGRLPFESASPVEVAVRRLTEPVPALDDLRADAPPVLAALATSALAVDPADRPADGAILLAALDGSSRFLTDTPDPGLAPAPSRRGGRRLGVLAGGAGAVAVAVAGFSAGFVMTGEEPAPATPQPTTQSASRSEKTSSRAQSRQTEGPPITQAGGNNAEPTSAGQTKDRPATKAGANNADPTTSAGSTPTAEPTTSQPVTTEPMPTTDPAPTESEPVTTAPTESTTVP